MEKVERDSFRSEYKLVSLYGILKVEIEWNEVKDSFIRSSHENSRIPLNGSVTVFSQFFQLKEHVYSMVTDLDSKRTLSLNDIQ